MLASSSRYLDTLESLHKAIRTHTAIPLPTLLKRDDTTSTIPYPYSLYSHPSGIPLRDLYTSPSSPSDPSNTLVRLKAELKLGALLKSLHDNVQNDWFGPPGEDEANRKEWGECYSWQEAFTLLVEGVLEEVRGLLTGLNLGDGGDEEAPSTSIPTKDIHRLLSRAIGSFLFDDVEVPSLVFYPSLSVSDWLSCIFVSNPSTPSTTASLGTEDNPTRSEKEAEEEPEITALILTPSESSIWGDPLLEGCFASSFFSSFTNANIGPNITSSPRKDTGSPDSVWPSKAFLEGYTSTPILLPRHRTKRMWYDLYAALRELVVFLGEEVEDDEGERGCVRKTGVKGRIRRIRENVRRLEDSPCY